MIRNLMIYEPQLQKACIMEATAVARDTAFDDKIVELEAHGDLIVSEKKFESVTTGDPSFCAHIFFYKRRVF
jgi:hypothetical protein